MKKVLKSKLNGEKGEESAKIKAKWRKHDICH